MGATIPNQRSFRRPAKDYTEIGFNKTTMVRKGLLDKQSEAIPSQGLMSEDQKSLLLINNRSLPIHLIGEAKITSVTYDAILDQYRGSVEVPHTLGYPPVFMAFWRGATVPTFGIASSPIPYSQYAIDMSGLSGVFSISAFTDKDKITFNLYFFSSGIPADLPYTIKYYIYKLPIANE